jgi:hypothetical protein
VALQEERATPIQSHPSGEPVRVLYVYLRVVERGAAAFDYCTLNTSIPRSLRPSEPLFSGILEKEFDGQLFEDRIRDSIHFIANVAIAGEVTELSDEYGRFTVLLNAARTQVALDFPKWMLSTDVWTFLEALDAIWSGVVDARKKQFEQGPSASSSVKDALRVLEGQLEVANEFLKQLIDDRAGLQLV